MRVALMFPSKYLRSADLRAAAEQLGEHIQLKIKSVAMETLVRQGGAKERKPVMRFDAPDDDGTKQTRWLRALAEKGWVLNKTNATRLAELLESDETDHWPGASVVLRVDAVQFGPRQTDGIRVQRVVL
jgi:hypothetical protein